MNEAITFFYFTSICFIYFYGIILVSSDQVLNLRGELWPVVFNVASYDVLGNCSETALVEFLRPVGQADPAFECSHSFGSDFF